MRKAPHTPSAASGELERLVRLEDRLSARQAEARARGDALLAAARAEAERVAADAERELQREIARLRDEAAAARAAHEQELRRASEARRHALLAVPDERVAEVAAATVADLVAELAAGARS